MKGGKKGGKEGGFSDEYDDDQHYRHLKIFQLGLSEFIAIANPTHVDTDAQTQRVTYITTRRHPHINIKSNIHKLLQLKRGSN